MTALAESIFNLVPETYEVYERAETYKSKFVNASLTGSTFCTHGTTQPIGAAHASKQAHSTFGLAAADYLPSPKRFLKKGERSVNIWATAAKSAMSSPAGSPEKSSSTATATATLTRRHSFENGNNLKKPPAPRRSERPAVLSLRPTEQRNYITANAVEVMLAPPGKGQGGAARAAAAAASAAATSYLHKEDYGKVPAYLTQVRGEIQRETDMIDAFVREQMGIRDTSAQDTVEAMDPAEREELLDALKTKWDAVNKQYQLMAHVVDLDSFGKRRRKEGYEKELTCLERDILKLESSGSVFIRQ